MRKCSVSLCFCGCLLAVATAARASHIEETMTLEKGWNAIYLESTPDESSCEAFFKRAPVERVAVYRSDAYSYTRQLADDGTEILQKPISYHVWVPGDEDASTMTALAGGRAYMIYATDSWSTTFLGVPAAPQQTWRATSGETGFMNIVGVCAPADAALKAKEYFGEGPYGGAAGSAAYKIGGVKTDAPMFLSMAISASAKVQGGKAYALTATKDADWPGVIGFLGESTLAFGSGDFSGVTLQNFGTKDRVFRVSIVESADKANETFPLGLKRKVRAENGDASWVDVAAGVPWDVEIAAGGLSAQSFAVDRAGMEAGVAYAAVLQIEDLGGTQMRVRVPVTLEEKSADEADFPAGLWAGYVQLEAVSSLTNETPSAAAGTLKMNILVHVDANGTPRLLQRVASGVDGEGKLRLFKELAAAQAFCENPRRLSTVMMSVDTQSVEASDYKTFGDQVQFDWTVDAKARDNPFRHAWHPDHDGKTADYSGDVASGDDLANYVNPVKPELWSVGNALRLSWHEFNDPTGPVVFDHNPEETTAGFAVWSVGGLLSGGQINTMGVFYLKRIAAVGEIED